MRMTRILSRAGQWRRLAKKWGQAPESLAPLFLSAGQNSSDQDVSVPVLVRWVSLTSSFQVPLSASLLRFTV